MQTCDDHSQPDLPHGAVNVRRVLDLADEGSIVGELDLLDDDGGVAAHDVPRPGDPLPEEAIGWRIRPKVVVEHLRGTFCVRDLLQMVKA